MKKNDERCIVELRSQRESRSLTLFGMTNLRTDLQLRTSSGVRVATTAMHKTGASGDGGHDADGVAILGRGVFLGQIANVLIVDVNIHKAAQFSVLGKQMLAQLAKLGG